MAVERDDLEKALLSKGFIKKTKGKDHAFYYYERDGRICKAIWTKISYGSKYKTYGDDLERRVRGQIRLSATDFKAFVECPFTEAMLKDYYISLKLIETT